MSWTSREIHDPRRTSWPRRFLIAGAILVGLFLVGCWLLSGNVDQRLAEIRKRGEPITYAELYEWIPLVPSDRDATELWLEAAEELQTAAGRANPRRLPILGQADEPPVPGQPWPDLDYAEQFVLDNAESLAKAHQAAALGGEGDYRQNIKPDAIATLLTPIQTLRSGARGLTLEAEVHAHRGRPHEAAQSINALLRQTHALDREPFLVSQLIRCAILGIGIQQLQKTLGRVEFSEDDLVQLDETLRGIDMAKAVKLGMLGERVYGLETFNDVNVLNGGNWKFAITRPLRHLDKGMYLDVLSELIAAADEPWPELLAKYDAIGAGMKNRLSPVHIFSSQLLPALNAYASSCARSETARRVAIIAIALERYRRAEGHPAPDLAALVPKYLAEVPMDPTSDSPLDYRVTGTDYVVFSPSKRFPVVSTPCGEQWDEETGANPLLLFRWPPRVPEPCSPKAAQDGNDEAEGAVQPEAENAAPE